MADKTTYVIINSDTDPAIEPINKNFKKETVWEKTIVLVKKIRETLDEFEDDYGNNPRVVWHLRSDRQMYEIWEEWAFPAVEYHKFFKQLEAEGDKIGWHPHLWRFDINRGSWYQETQDKEWIQNCLEKGYQMLSKLFKVNSVRMGWNFHNNFTMALIAKLGIKIDLSGLPKDKNNKTPKRPWGEYNWETTPNMPYFPSVKDYRVPGNLNLSVLEIPLTTFKFPAYLNYVYSTITGRKVCSSNLLKNPLLMRYGIEYVVKTLKLSDNSFVIFSTTFHPGDLLKNSKLFSIKYAIKNISYLLDLSKKENITVEFVTPDKVLELFLKCNGTKGSVWKLRVTSHTNE